MPWTLGLWTNVILRCGFGTQQSLEVGVMNYFKYWGTNYETFLHLYVFWRLWGYSPEVHLVSYNSMPLPRNEPSATWASSNQRKSQVLNFDSKQHVRQGCKYSRSFHPDRICTDSSCSFVKMLVTEGLSVKLNLKHLTCGFMHTLAPLVHDFLHERWFWKHVIAVQGPAVALSPPSLPVPKNRRVTTSYSARVLLALWNQRTYGILNHPQKHEKHCLT